MEKTVIKELANLIVKRYPSAERLFDDEEFLDYRVIGILIDSHAGVYIPAELAEMVGEKLDPENEWYWEDYEALKQHIAERIEKVIPQYQVLITEHPDTLDLILMARKERE